MPLTYQAIYLGQDASFLDPTEGNSDSENASLLLGRVFGSYAQPLFQEIVTLTAADYAGGASAAALETNNDLENATLTSDLGAGPQIFVFDGTVTYQAKLTYADGSSADISAVVAQTTTGELFLMPEATGSADGDIARFAAKPIASVSFGVPVETTLDLEADRAVMGLDDGYVDGTAGDDSIDAEYLEPSGQGSDRVDAGDAGLAGSSGDDDHIRALDGADSVLAGAGQDTVEGGTGDDTLSGDAGDDRLFGEAGDDALFGGAGDDLIAAGDGSDTLTILAEAGVDTILGGEAGSDLDALVFADDASGVSIRFSGPEAGSYSFATGTTSGTFDEIERLYGTSVSDTIDASDATAGIWFDGCGGDDTVLGGIGADWLLGNAGNDSLDAGQGNDSLFAGDGNDTLRLNGGTDAADGGADADLFVLGANALTATVIYGGTTGFDQDTLDLSAWGWGRTRLSYSAPDRQTGSVELLDTAGNVTGTVSFVDIEKVIPCFTPGSLILTDRGEQPVEQLMAGDRVLTRDNGWQELRWIGRRDLGADHLRARPNFNPIRISKGALGNGLPERDMLVSPQHRMLITGPRAEMLFAEHEVLVAAVHLVELPGVERVRMGEVRYIHLLCDRHEIIRADGAWTESFQPGEMSLGGADSPQRQEVLELFPELARGTLFPGARLTLKRHEARVLLSA